MASAASFTGEAGFQYEGENFRITLDNMALLEAESVLGESMLDFIPQIAATIEAGGNPQMRHMAAIFYGGLKQNHPDITQKQVVDMVMSRDQGLLGALSKAMAGVEVPDDPEGNVSAPAAQSRGRKKKKAGTGTGSSKRGAKRVSRQKTSG